VLGTRTEVALETVTVLSKRAAVQHRLRKLRENFGYSGFSDMQRVFQAEVAAAILDLCRAAANAQRSTGAAIQDPVRCCASSARACTIPSQFQTAIDEDKLEDAVQLCLALGTSTSSP